MKEEDIDTQTSLVDSVIEQINDIQFDINTLVVYMSLKELMKNEKMSDDLELKLVFLGCRKRFNSMFDKLAEDPTMLEYMQIVSPQDDDEKHNFLKEFIVEKINSFNKSET